MKKDESKSNAVDEKVNFISSAAVQTFPTSSPSIVAHWNPHLDPPSQNPQSIPPMISHFILPPEEKLLSKEDFLKLWAEHREQVKKDWKEIFSKISILNI